MIKSIHVRQFQSLRDVNIELGKLTVIVGSTNVGKSALLRAVKAVAENRRGDGFITTGYEECQTVIYTATSIILWRKPNKKSAICYVGIQEYGIQSCETVTQDQALTVLGIRKIQLSNSVAMLVNFQNQLDAPFLLAESDIVKSKVLGEITNASLVLISINQIKKLAMQNQNLYSVRSQDITNTKASLEKYSTVPILEQQLNQAKLKTNTLLTKSGNKEKLSQIFTKLAEVVTAITRDGKVVHKMAWYFNYQIPSIYFGQPKIHQDIDKLDALISWYDAVQKLVIQAKTIKLRIDIIEMSLPDTTRVEQLMNQLTVLAGYYEAIEGNKQTLSLLNQESNQTESQLKLADKDLIKLRDELQICPLCESVMTEVHTHPDLDRDHGPYCTESAILTDSRGDHTVYCGDLKDHEGTCDYVRAF